MKIKSLNIIEFGGLCNVSLELCDGMNVIEGLNESGKSTINAFIRFALYGLTAAKRAGGTVTDKKHYPSFKNGLAQGSLVLEHKGELYRIERKGQQGATYRESFAVYNAVTGDKLAIKGEPGEYFLGVPDEVFESSCCIRQNELREVKGDQVSDAMQNMLVSGDKDVDVDKARRRLDAARKTLRLQKGSGGRLTQLENEIAALEASLAQARAISGELKLRRAEAESKMALAKRLREDTNALRVLDALYDDYEKLQSFDKLRAIRQKIADIEARIERLKLDYNCEGFVPGRQYYDDLRTVERQISEAQNALELATLQLEQSKRQEKIDERLCEGASRIEALGGGDTVQEIFRIRRAQQKKRRLSGVLLIVFAIVCGAVGAFLGIKIMPALFAVSGVGALLAVLGIVMLSLSSKDKKAILGLLSSVGYVPTGAVGLFDLQSYIGDCTSEKMRLESYELGVTSYSKALAERTAELEAVLDDASMLLTPYEDGIEPVCENATRLLDTIKDTARSVMEFIEKHERLLRELELETRGEQTLAQLLCASNEADIRARLTPERISQIEAASRDEIRMRIRYNESAIASSEESRVSVQRRVMELESSTADPNELLAKISAKKSELERLRFTFDAIMLAMESMDRAAESLRHSVTPRLCALASENMSAMTGGRYQSLQYNSDSRLIVVTDATRDVDTLSAGTKDAAYLSLRLAMTRLLFGQENAVLTVDEGLASLDDVRAEAFLRMLCAFCEGGAQCILFTCHDRERRLLDAKEVGFNSIRLA